MTMILKIYFILEIDQSNRIICTNELNSKVVNDNVRIMLNHRICRLS